MTFCLHSFFFIDSCKDSGNGRNCKGKQELIFCLNSFSDNSLLLVFFSFLQNIIVVLYPLPTILPLLITGKGVYVWKES
ncbi:hypothetical protein HMPREF2992_04035 [Prevotella sp. HMSC069G02]|uniref:Uncharacterized protein n=1 Tax=Segatella oris F0302 TaxID=649760 RepID=D1QSL4_9BACT|nr:hypothetical protein HMPREF0971_01972 [Segatella oris F0302]OFP40911.1 hypothetical protein HMPREF2992_04035 [Prevotella sp. HMSC069G02]